MRTLFLAFLSLAAFAATCKGEDVRQPAGFPARPVEIVVPFPKGGGMDRCMRVLAEHLGPELGQRVDVANITKGGNIAGNKYGIDAAPDGYVLTGWGPGLVTDSLLVKSADYTFRDVRPLCMVSSDPHVIVVGGKFAREHGIRTLGDLLNHIAANPGRVTAGVGGNWTTHDFLRIKLEEAAGAKTARMVFLGGAPALKAVAEANCDLSAPLVSEFLPYADNPAVVALGIAYGNRVEQLPDVPTTGEQGFSEMHQVLWRVLSVPKGTPGSVADYLEWAIRKTMDKPEFIDDARKAGFMPFYMGSEELESFLVEEYRHYERRVHEWGIAVER